MRVFRGFSQLSPSLFLNPVATLGVFDGVHLGHRDVLKKTRSRASSTGGTSVAITFHPHPLAVLRKRAPPMVDPLSARLELFEEIGIENAVILAFNRDLAEMTARDFVERVFVRGIGARWLVLGPDSFFGKDRQGDSEFLRRVSHRYQLDVESLPFREIAGIRVSSTAVREAIQAGNLLRAGEMLGRAFTLRGTVVPGDGRGRELGFPTANLTTDQVLPPKGVYVAKTMLEASEHATLVNIGVRPTFSGGSAVHVEAHLLDFSGDLYGSEISVQLFQQLRDERKFSRREDLMEQILKDVAELKSLGPR